ncbi:type 11 methyltransferase [Actinoplanes sp. SE50]|uniref:class I SAM-dependent DNA methyltransferase n=1 Tax=unclassified Actinoplanes TaxID=2626549 RepID=UPI00023ECB2E|nr:MULTISPECIES: class I SAM-dependent methyltransferase [unclassified Actinoplanes]AEV84791.1 methyltransferase type 11 [Actinoplanes sp. SE50/110]ATO83183.1 type 11 methyltransferase [Actinoplanes sp. SE50]SLM00590.1 type 11 methyltransferase [Actinoplanes sp. SE50/110]
MGEDGHAAVRDAYSALSGVYIDLFGTVEQSHPDDVAFIERHLTIRPGRVLDLGCGPGHLTGLLRSRGVAATGIDMVPEFLAYARATHPDGDYRQGSLTSLDVADESVAGILAWYSLIHLPPDALDAVLDGFRRVTAPGATLVVGIFEAPELGPFDHRVATAYRWPVDAFSARLARAGFDEVERQRRPADATTRPLAALAATRRA